MRIAINTRFLTEKNLSGLGRFAYETSNWMVKHHPEHEYFFIFDRKFPQQYIPDTGVTPLVIPPPARHPLLWYLWYEWTLPYMLRKHKIDLFISTDGLGSLRSRVPSCTVIHDLAFEHFPDQVSYLTRQYYRYFIPRYVRKSHVLAAVSEATCRDIATQYQIPATTITNVESACSGYFRPLNEAEQLEVRKRYTDGKPYFIFVGVISPRKNTVRILEAFELYKKRHEGSAMQLVLVGRKAWLSGEFEEALKQHSYREDILHLEHIGNEELVQLLGSACASLYPSLLEGFGLPILEAQKCHTPVITSNCFSMPEVAGDAALLVDPHDVSDLCRKMEMVSDDPALRQELINKGRHNWPRYSWERTAELLYECALSALPKQQVV